MQMRSENMRCFLSCAKIIWFLLYNNRHRMHRAVYICAVHAHISLLLSPLIVFKPKNYNECKWVSPCQDNGKKVLYFFFILFVSHDRDKCLQRKQYLNETTHIAEHNESVQNSNTNTPRKTKNSVYGNRLLWRGTSFNGINLRTRARM